MCLTVSRVELKGWTEPAMIEGDCMVEVLPGMGLLQISVSDGKCTSWLVADQHVLGRGLNEMVHIPDGHIFFVHASSILQMN